MKTKWIEIHTHLGDDLDKMCLFLNKSRIGYQVGEMHHMTGYSGLKDYPHYTACFVIDHYSDVGFERVTKTIKEEAQHISYHLQMVDLVERKDD